MVGNRGWRMSERGDEIHIWLNIRMRMNVKAASIVAHG